MYGDHCTLSDDESWISASDTVLPIVNGTLATLTKDGTIAKLQKKWFNIDFSKVPALK